jgi:DNA-binding transcriptional LysR family regulator
MQEINLRSVDLNLLTIFEAVFEECSQIKASERLGMTQPAISHAMARLRHLMDDPLFIVRGRTLTPTPRSEELYVRVHEALALVRDELQRKHALDLENSQRTFVISISHGAGTVSGPHFLSAFREAAPNARLVIRHVDPEEEIPQMLRDQRLDLAYHHFRLDDPMLEHVAANTHEIVMVVSNNHPRIRETPTLEDFLKEHFVTVHEPLVRVENDSLELERFLKKLAALTTLEIPSASQLPLYVESSDLVGITSRNLARWMCQHYNIRPFALPISVPPVASYLVWHRERDGDVTHQWFRETFLQTLQKFGT